MLSKTEGAPRATNQVAKANKTQGRKAAPRHIEVQRPLSASATRLRKGGDGGQRSSNKPVSDPVHAQPARKPAAPKAVRPPLEDLFDTEPVADDSFDHFESFVLVLAAIGLVLFGVIVGYIIGRVTK